MRTLAQSAQSASSASAKTRKKGTPPLTPGGHISDLLMLLNMIKMNCSKKLSGYSSVNRSPRFCPVFSLKMPDFKPEMNPFFVPCSAQMKRTPRISTPREPRSWKLEAVFQYSILCAAIQAGKLDQASSPSNWVGQGARGMILAQLFVEEGVVEAGAGRIGRAGSKKMASTRAQYDAARHIGQGSQLV